MNIPTEKRNPWTINIDRVPTLLMMQMFNNEDKKVAAAVKKHLPAIAAAADAITEKFRVGGRIVYIGAGTSGRIGFMDAAECPPTFNVPAGRVVALMAGGVAAFSQAVEGAEDSKELAVADLQGIAFSKNDVLVGLAASGRTPYVVGGMEYASNIIGATTVSVTCNEDMTSPVNSWAAYPIGIYAGPEAITGSTRMKAGTVQKLVVNMLSTAVMVKMGLVHSNLMTNVQIKNEKLLVRAKGIIKQLTSATDEEIETALHEAENDVSMAINILK